MSKPSNPKKRLLYDDIPATNSTTTQDANTEDQIFQSSPIHDRNSTFTAHFHPGISIFATSNSQKATTPLTTLIKRAQGHPAFTDASHRIVAWRKRSAQTTLPVTQGPANTTGATQSRPVYTLSSDDDGEKYAGKRVEKVLAETDVEGILVVARWYGGVLLGPVRFAHIENVAREAVRKWKESVGLGIDGGGAKRQRLDRSGGAPEGDGVEDEGTRVRLAKQLVERDSSIAVLRGLLAEKTKPKISAARDEKIDPSQESASTASPAKKIDYSDMPLAKLRQLEKARDATIAFILKQLDKAEEEEQKKEAEELEAIMATMDDEIEEHG
ncbi:hypothetical protein H2200_006205 [Cladophialophora chaetospira]|uniref:Impact N-terminal domain-containing protein n=1 Tax=Cladophialophora chaetospira TaxID=386627 RepID=A0AA38XAR0_9EURO|nr:hypothetical protein H2200_006205 [Cladophialophora chaetospira]